jgi:hypothetical protein
MAETDKNGLVLFKNYLGLKPVKGSFPPPYSIKAEDLDNNFRRLSIIEQPDPTTAFYTVQVTDMGTILKFNLQTINYGGKILNIVARLT